MTKKEPAPHGTRRCYFSRGCRCQECREANAAYQRERRKLGPFQVSVDDVARHIIDLSTRGVGTRAIAEAVDLDRHTIQWIKRGRVRKIHRATAERLLKVDVDVMADHSLISARTTRARIAGLVEGGYTRLWIARQLGYKGTGLPFLYTKSRWISAINALRVERLVKLINAGKVER